MPPLYEKESAMDEVTKVTLEAMLFLRQRLEQRLDAEFFRLTNGLYPIRETTDELIEMIRTSTYSEILHADRIVSNGD